MDESGPKPAGLGAGPGRHPRRLGLTSAGSARCRNAVVEVVALVARRSFRNCSFERAQQFGERARGHAQGDCANVKLHHTAVADIDGSHTAFGQAGLPAAPREMLPGVEEFHGCVSLAVGTSNANEFHYLFFLRSSAAVVVCP